MNFEELDVRQVALEIKEEGGRERHMKDVSKMLKAPIMVVSDRRDEETNFSPEDKNRTS